MNYGMLTIGAWLITVAGASPTPPPAPPRLDVYPPAIHLSSADDQQRIVAVLTDATGVTRDVTADLAFAPTERQVVTIRGATLSPACAEGATRMIIRWQDQQVALPVVVRDGQHLPPVSFTKDVLPTLTKAGCNTGTCHGSSRGKDGFRLSLFGFDPDGDYHRITRELAARRINLAIPAESLLLQKAVGAVTHTGGNASKWTRLSIRPFRRGWHRAALPDGTDVPRVERLELYPPEVVVEGSGQGQALLVMAHYTDGTDRDVTGLAVFRSSDESVAGLKAGQVVAGARGESFVTARYETHTVGVPILVLPEQSELPPAAASRNFVDELVGEKLRKLRIPASPLCDDEQFLRRLSVDVIGQLPTEEAFTEFMADQSPDKRSAWIDRLLSREEFADVWAAKWGDLLMIRQIPNIMSEKAVQTYAHWLREQIVAGKPFDQIVSELLTSTGRTFEEPAANFYALEPNKLKVAENVAQVFLGIRTQCAQCHNHPFDRWTMDDYYGFAAFFARIGRKPHEDYRQWIIFPGGGETRHPITMQVVPPKLLGGESPAIANGEDRRVSVARWITSPDNPYFSRAVANRIWEHFLGRGIIDPVDDIRVSNPPSNQRLLDALSEKLVEYDYDFRKLSRDILTSATYQRSSTPLPQNQHDHRNFAQAAVRRIPATSLIDCISQVTAVPTKYPRQPLGSRAVESPDDVPGNYFLKTFGRASRASASPARRIRPQPSPRPCTCSMAIRFTRKSSKDK